MEIRIQKRLAKLYYMAHTLGWADYSEILEQPEQKTLMEDNSETSITLVGRIEKSMSSLTQEELLREIELHREMVQQLRLRGEQDEKEEKEESEDEAYDSDKESSLSADRFVRGLFFSYYRTLFAPIPPSKFNFQQVVEE